MFSYLHLACKFLSRTIGFIDFIDVNVRGSGFLVMAASEIPRNAVSREYRHVFTNGCAGSHDGRPHFPHDRAQICKSIR